MKPRAPDGTTLQHRVFVVLLTASLDAAAIAARVGVHKHAVHTACRYMAKRGKVSVHKLNARLVIYAAVGRRPPKDRRGTRPGSRNWKYSTIVAMNVARIGKQWRPKPRGSALDEAWRPAALTPAAGDP